jgi:ribosomal-protein-alanine N-acetyltransferase
MLLQSGDIILRPLQNDDAHRLSMLANNIKIGRNLRDGFPFPYTLKDAKKFIKRFKNHPTLFAIQYKGEYAGNISLLPQEDVYRNTAEIGYFIGEPYWNKGIMTVAVNLITEFGFKVFNFARIHTGVYSYNPASQRVLTKCGFIPEAVFRKNVFKDGQLHDEVRFAKINPDVENGTWQCK